jgi:hypothetical protein
VNRLAETAFRAGREKIGNDVSKSIISVLNPTLLNNFQTRRKNLTATLSHDRQTVVFPLLLIKTGWYHGE